MGKGTVAIATTKGTYPAEFPFDPHERYPEYHGEGISSEQNGVFAAVRECFHELGLDDGKFGAPDWNPLGEIIKPGDRVFIKPNLVTHEFRKSCNREGDLFSVITHPAVVRAVADYVAIALQGKGEIVIGDNPSIDANFAILLEKTQLDRFEELYRKRGVQCRVLDLRPLITDDLRYYGFRSKVKKQSGDPEGESIINLGRHSAFKGMNPLFFRGVFTKRWETIRHHFMDKHEYSISNTVLNSDVYISVPKLKAHHKVGATLNIKGLVGINYNKNYLVHWRIGFPITGGDEFPAPRKASDYVVLMLRHMLIDLLPESIFLRLRRMTNGTFLNVIFQDIKGLSYHHHRGAWHGNDTTWRMAADLYNVFIKDLASWRAKNGKAPLRTFSIVDGVIAGEGDGPFCPTAKDAQVVIAGEDLLQVDCVSARMMDYHIQYIRYLTWLLQKNSFDLSTLEVRSSALDTAGFFSENRRYLGFVAPKEWPELSMACPQTAKISDSTSRRRENS